MDIALPGLFIAAWAVVGWLAGAPLARVVRRLEAGPEPGSSSARWARRFPILVSDLQLQTLSGASFGLLAARHPLPLPLLIYSAYAATLALFLVIDLRTRYVYSALVYPALLATLILTPLAANRPFWFGVAGAVLGGLSMGVVYLLGRILYRDTEALGAGDISLAAIIGAMVGGWSALSALLLGILISGAFALLVAVRTRSLKVLMPYGPGLCLGALASLAFGP